MSDLHEKPISGTAASLQAVSAVTLVWTFLTSALVAAGLALLSVAAFARAAARKPAAPAPILSYDPTTGVSSMRRETVVQFESDGRPLACIYASTRSPRVVCPQDYGAVGGGCDGGAPGDFLVTWRGSGWICPELDPGKKGAVSVSASVLCCKYHRRR